MSPTHTEKYDAALQVAHDLKIRVRDLSNAGLYQALADRGLLWDNKEGRWRPQRPSDESEFLDEDGQPSGIFKLHITAHPKEVRGIAQQVVNALKREGMPLEVVNGPIPNKRGVGYIIYLAGQVRK